MTGDLKLASLETLQERVDMLERSRRRAVWSAVIGFVLIVPTFGWNAIQIIQSIKSVPETTLYRGDTLQISAEPRRRWLDFTVEFLLANTGPADDVITRAWAKLDGADLHGGPLMYAGPPDFIFRQNNIVLPLPLTVGRRSTLPLQATFGSVVSGDRWRQLATGGRLCLAVGLKSVNTEYSTSFTIEGPLDRLLAPSGRRQTERFLYPAKC